MASWDKPKKKHTAAKAFAKVAIYGAMIFGSYQYYTPDRVKDAIGQKIEQTTHSQMLGHAFSSSKPAPVTIQTAPKPPGQ